MNGIADILKSGRAPGIRTGAPDPTSADVAVPRALKEVFDLPYRHKKNLRREQVEQQIGYNASTLRKTWKGLN
jgi:hypothetical protein